MSKKRCKRKIKKSKIITKCKNNFSDNNSNNKSFFEKWELKILDDIIELEQELKNKINNIIIEEHNYSLKIN
ncbi:hypothetical protein [Spiroplasma endosymbiont of Tricholauxania praeusta]|uniref:hypothetical protein n=1 Tax=Spiroplasma endosymbiont of Tricholauxania praeusta TaxID=3066296 RepID=UPI0030D58ABD